MDQGGNRDTTGRASSRSSRQTASSARSTPWLGWSRASAGSQGVCADAAARCRRRDRDRGAALRAGLQRLGVEELAHRRGAAVDGLAGIEYDLVASETGDPTLELHITYGDGFFYDPKSYDEGFTDCRFMGVAKWCTKDQVKEIVPEKADQIEDMAETGSDMVDVTEDRPPEKLVQHLDEARSGWSITGTSRTASGAGACIAGHVMLMRGDVPFIDEKGKTFPRYRMFSPRSTTMAIVTAIRAT